MQHILFLAKHDESFFYCLILAFGVSYLSIKSLFEDNIQIEYKEKCHVTKQYNKKTVLWQHNQSCSYKYKKTMNLGKF